MSETLREGVERLLADSCHHCGRMPDADNDHTCLCPVTDSECLTHAADPVVSRDHLRALLAATAPTPDEVGQVKGLSDAERAYKAVIDACPGDWNGTTCDDCITRAITARTEATR